jgi:hypothetical protein
MKLESCGNPTSPITTKSKHREALLPPRRDHTPLAVTYDFVEEDQVTVRTEIRQRADFGRSIDRYFTPLNL